MPILPNNTGDAFQAIKTAIKDRIEMIPTAGKTWSRIRYADNLNDWLQIAAIDTVAGEQVVRVVFVYLAGFSSRRAEARQREITATFGIEVIQGFFEGTDLENSTDIFEHLLGEIEMSFRDQMSLGFTDAASQEVANEPFNAQDDLNGKPVYVDGILAHRVTGELEVIFRLC
jgi:hypothetical protein